MLLAPELKTKQNKIVKATQRSISAFSIPLTYVSLLLLGNKFYKFLVYSLPFSLSHRVWSKLSSVYTVIGRILR